MAELKTKPTAQSVSDFLTREPEARRRDCLALVEMMREATGADPVMWGPSIVGFGSYHYKYASGREGDWPIIGFSPRKKEITLYIMPGFEPFADLMAKLGTYRTGVSCLYVKQLADIDQKVLRQLLARAVKDMKARAPS